MWRKLRWRLDWRRPCLSSGRFPFHPQPHHPWIIPSQDDRVRLIQKPESLNRQGRRGYVVLNPEEAAKLWVPDIIIDKAIFVNTHHRFYNIIIDENFIIWLFRRPKSVLRNTSWRPPPSGSTRTAPSSASQNNRDDQTFFRKRSWQWNLIKFTNAILISLAISSVLNGFYRYSARKNYDLYCGMDFRMFPVDTQARLSPF